MKRYIAIFLFLVLISAVGIPFTAYALDVSHAVYSGIIKIVNASSAASNVATVMTLDPVTFKSVYDIDDAWDYVAVVPPSGGAAKFMPGKDAASPWCIYVPSMAASQQLNYLFYAGNSDLDCTKYYFPGSTGGSVPDGMTEPGNNFEVDLATIMPILTASYTPTIRAQNNGVGTASTVPAAMPTGWASGDMLLVIIDTYDAGSATNPSITTPSGWTQLWHTATGSYKRYAAYYKVATGAESNPTNFTVDRNSYYAYRSIAITAGTWIGAAVVGVTSTGSSSNPNPPTATASIVIGANLFIATCSGQDAMASAPVNYSGLQSQVQNSAAVSIATRVYASLTDDPGTFGTSTATWASNTIIMIGYPSNPLISHYDTTNGGFIVYPSSTSAITLQILGAGATSTTVGGLTAAEFSHIKASLSGGTLTVTAGASSNSTAFAGSIPNSTSNWYFADGDGTIYVQSITYTQGGAKVDMWDWEYAATFTGDTTGNVFTPSFRTTSSDGDVSASLISFSPISLAIPPGFSISDAPDFITHNSTMEGQFTTGNVSSTGGPPGFAFISEIANAGKVPNIWLFGIIATCVIVGGHFFWIWMQRRFGFRSMWPFFITGVAVIGLLVALGGTVKVFDFWMIFFYILIFICLMVMSRHTEVGGSVSTHGMIGFAAQSWMGLTVINRMLEGAFVGAQDTAWVNTFAFTQDFKLFNIFTVPVLNTDFWTKGIPSLMRWDYSFFGGNAQMFEYLLYCLTAVIAFILFGLLIGLLYNFFK